MNRYKFSSLTEFNAVLQQYNVMADRGREGMIMFQKKRLLYSMLDAKGNKIGVPVKASMLHSKPTLKNLEALFQRGASLKQNERERLTKVIDSFFNTTARHSPLNFCEHLKSNGINAMFRENKEGRIYGLTFIDNKSGAVFNGSGLGKRYSCQAIMKRFQAISSQKDVEKEKFKVLSQTNKEGQLQFQDCTSSYVQNQLSNELFSLMKPVKSGDEPINSRLKETKKKKRRIS